MKVSCEEVWREISSYLDGEGGPNLRAAMEEHFRECTRCTAVLDGTRNVIQLYGDERMLEVPLGFSRRLHRSLEENIRGGRRSFLGWIVAAAAASLVGITFEVGRSFQFRHPELRSHHAQPGARIPPEMMVVASADGKVFHIRGCPFIHDEDKLRTMAAQEALQEGYTPCVRCLGRYLGA